MPRPFHRDLDRGPQRKNTNRPLPVLSLVLVGVRPKHKVSNPNTGLITTMGTDKEGTGTRNGASTGSSRDMEAGTGTRTGSSERRGRPYAELLG